MDPIRVQRSHRGRMCGRNIGQNTEIIAEQTSLPPPLSKPGTKRFTFRASTGSQTRIRHRSQVLGLRGPKKDDRITYEVDGPFCNGNTVITVRQSKSLEDSEIGKQFAPLWKVLARCEDNASGDPFSQCESLQGIRVQVRNSINGYSDKLN